MAPEPATELATVADAKCVAVGFYAYYFEHGLSIESRSKRQVGDENEMRCVLLSTGSLLVYAYNN